jgi:lipopolysaccharide/colanic/teichoic acid biosynthesis glycosyltransferase
MAKRMIDVAMASAGLLLLSPLFAAVALAVLLALGRPILYRQVRPGLGGMPFTLLKFRTMTTATDAGGLPLEDRRRMTPIGRLIRRMSLDELPQLWNVLRGDMSFVGPRPLLVEYLPYYTERERKRHDVRPGITGLAQVSGRNLLPWDERLEMDVQYVERRSLWLDLKIVIQTVRKVLCPRDVVEPGRPLAKMSDERRERRGASASEELR